MKFISEKTDSQRQVGIFFSESRRHQKCGDSLVNLNSFINLQCQNFLLHFTDIQVKSFNEWLSNPCHVSLRDRVEMNDKHGSAYQSHDIFFSALSQAPKLGQKVKVLFCRHVQVPQMWVHGHLGSIVVREGEERFLPFTRAQKTFILTLNVFQSTNHVRDILAFALQFTAQMISFLLTSVRNERSSILSMSCDTVVYFCLVHRRVSGW